jgi:hypothetical protein
VLNTLNADQIAVIVLKGNVVITYTAQDVFFQAASEGGSEGGSQDKQPVFQVMPMSTAANFSTPDANGDFTVGIMGCTGLRNLYLEFNISKQTLGFAQIPSE